MNYDNLLKVTSKILLSLSILFISIGIAYALEGEQSTQVFTDIDVGHEHYVAIKYLKEKGLIEGYEDGSFQPRREINRAEALKILMGAFAEPEIEEDKSLIDSSDEVASTEEVEESAEVEEKVYFEDVPLDAWYYPYISKAWSKGVVAGYPDGLFHPEFTINRAESLKMALLEEGLSIPEEILEKPYTDVPLDAWFTAFAQVSKDRSLYLRSRSDGGLYPDQNLNRGDFADFIYRLLRTRDQNTRFARTTWYGFEDVNWGTASGEKFDTNLPTAAHKTLPFNTKLLVTNLSNGKTVIVKVNDRGPVAPGIDLDLTSSAFEAISTLGTGIVVTEFEIIDDELPNSEPSYVDEYGF